MNNMAIEERILDAMLKQEPKPPKKEELGGGMYYRCHWIKCNNEVHRYQNYCDQCGQKIDWSDL